jgi:hypothetical protein
VLKAAEQNNFQINDNDVIGVTESLVARAQGNYASVADIAADIIAKFAGDIAILFPILSRNRFSLILKGIAMSGKKIHLYLSYPCDEVGNHLLDVDRMDELGIEPYVDTLSETRYRQLFGSHVPHPFTGSTMSACIKAWRPRADHGSPDQSAESGARVYEGGAGGETHERHRIKGILKKAGARRFTASTIS